MNARILLLLLAAACAERAAEPQMRCAMLELMPDGSDWHEFDRPGLAAFVRNVGHFKLDTSSKDAYSVESGLMLAEKWSTIHALAHGPATQPPLRGIVTRLPRPDLGDDCSTVAAVLRNTPDPGGEGRSVRGMIFVVRKTYRGHELIGASLDVFTHVRTLGERFSLARVIGPESGPIAVGEPLGPESGDRRGVAWFDGAGAWCYRVARDERVDIRKWPLTPGQLDAFLTIVDPY